MKKIITFLLLGALGFMAVAYFYEKDPSEAVWLHGTWQLSYDPDNNEKDYMEFFPDSSVKIKSNPRKVIAECAYVVKIGHVNLICDVRGEKRTVSMEVANEESELINKTGAIYTKL